MMIKWIKDVTKIYRDLPKEIYVLFIARVINRLGGFVHAFLTLFLTIRLGMSLVEAGKYIAFLGFASLFGTIAGGYLGDAFGRKKSYVIAQGTAAILLIPCGFLGDSMYIPYLLIASTFFNAIVGPINSAMVTDIVDKEDRKRTFSLLYYGINIGVAIGPIIAGYLFHNYISWIFWGDALTTLIALLLIIVFIPETKLSKEEIEEIKDTIDEEEKAESRGAIIAFLKRPLLVFYTLFSVLSGFVYAQSGFSLPATLEILFGEIDGPKLFGTLMSFNAIVVIFSTIIITKATEKIKPIYNIAFGNILYAVGFGMMAFVSNISLIFVSVFFWTLGEIIAVTNSGVFVANHTPITHRSRFNAIINIIRGTGHTMGPLIAGFIIGQFEMNGLWIITGILSIVAFVGLTGVGLSDRKKDVISCEDM